VLAQVLTPWHRLVEARVPAARTWAYCDDRSLKIRKEDATTEEQAVQLRGEAIEVTRRFDEAIGLKENEKKRQEWVGFQRVEHLGLRLAGLEDNVCNIILPAPRDGWEPVFTAVKKLNGMPGGIATRSKAATMFISPMTRWALPLIEPAPATLAKDLWQAITATRCKWWCQGRFWMENVQLHPVLGASVQAVRAAAKETAQAGSRTLQAAVEKHARGIGLRVREWSQRWGLVLQVELAADQRSKKAAATAARAETPAFVEEFGTMAFRPATPAGAHAARVAARVLAAKMVLRSRNDAEGIEKVDFEAQSHKD
jgi:hypothetical protein